MQDVKGNQNGYPVPGGIAGSPCPVAFKYGVLALQVGDWVTGQLFGNPNCGLGTVRQWN